MYQPVSLIWSYCLTDNCSERFKGSVVSINIQAKKPAELNTNGYISKDAKEAGIPRNTDERGIHKTYSHNGKA